MQSFVKQMARIKLLRGDITVVSCDAIVNAARNSLLGGSGVDGAIHKAAGPELLEECKGLNGCPTGEVRVTKGYNLPAKYVFHTPGPIWRGGIYDEMELLMLCYRNILSEACNMKLSSVAIPGISTGVYHFPKELAAEIAVNETKRFISNNIYPREVLFVIMDNELFSYYDTFLKPDYHV